MATGDSRTEYERAALHRAQLAARPAADAARQRALAGSRIARADLADRWSARKPDPRYPERVPAVVVAPVTTPGTYPTGYPDTY